MKLIILAIFFIYICLIFNFTTFETKLLQVREGFKKHKKHHHNHVHDHDHNHEHHH